MSAAAMNVNSGADASALQKMMVQLRANPKLPLIVGAAAAIAVIAALWLWSSAPAYRVLFSNLSDRDGGAVVTSLQQMNIPYKFSEGGSAVLVDAAQVHDVRLRLAAQGLPKGGSVGFELMDNQKFGTSQFAEQINYQRALEGEIAHSVESIAAVETARVHLAIPKPSLFVRDQQKPGASVVLTLHRGRSIDEGQISAITHLISSSVPELHAKNVTVVDQAGNLLSSPNTNNRGLDASQLKYTHEIEQNYIRRIEAILQPIVGSGNVKAQVTADVDFTTVEKTDEKYGPNQEPSKAAIRSQQSSDSNQQGVTPPGGVPGALSNQAPATPTAQINAPAGATTNTPAANRGPSNVRRDATTNYEIDRSIRHTQQGAGGIKRLSVAVVVNYRGVPDANGKPTAQAIPAAELEQIKNLAREAMGFSNDRGDSLNVVNSQFVSNENREPELPWWKQRENIELAKTLGKYGLIALLGMWLWFSIFRPLLRKHLQDPVAPQAVAVMAEMPKEEVKPDSQQLSVEAQERQEQRLQENMLHAQAIIEQDPRLAAMVIKNWINSGKEQQ